MGGGGGRDKGAGVWGVTETPSTSLRNHAHLLRHASATGEDAGVAVQRDAHTYACCYGGCGREIIYSYLVSKASMIHAL